MCKYFYKKMEFDQYIAFDVGQEICKDHCNKKRIIHRNTWKYLKHLSHIIVKIYVCNIQV